MMGYLAEWFRGTNGIEVMGMFSNGITLNLTYKSQMVLLLYLTA
jgi:hypothetical protein